MPPTRVVIVLALSSRLVLQFQPERTQVPIYGFEKLLNSLEGLRNLPERGHFVVVEPTERFQIGNHLYRLPDFACNKPVHRGSGAIPLHGFRLLVDTNPRKKMRFALPRFKRPEPLAELLDRVRGQCNDSV